MNKFWTITLAMLIACTSAMRMQSSNNWFEAEVPSTDDYGNSCTSKIKMCQDGSTTTTKTCPESSFSEM